MDKLIIKNENERIIREYEQHDKKTIEEQKKSFAEYFGIDQNQYTTSEINKATVAFNDIFDGASIVTKKEILDRIYQTILTADKKEDLDKVLKLVRDAYTTSPICKKSKIVATYDYEIEKNYDLMVSVAVKKTFYTYWLKKLLSYKQNITDIEYAKCKTNDVNTLLQMVEETMPEQASKNGTRDINERIFLDTIDYAFFKYQDTLCANYQHVLNCQRTLDILSKDYMDKDYDFPDFITQGFIHEYGDNTCNEYFVQRCNHFDKTKKKENPAKRRQLSQTIYDFYTAGTTVEFASEPLQYTKNPNKKTSK